MEGFLNLVRNIAGYMGDRDDADNWILTVEDDNSIMDGYNGLSPAEKDEVQEYIRNFVQADDPVSNNIGILLDLVRMDGPYSPYY